MCFEVKFIFLFESSVLKMIYFPIVLTRNVVSRKV